MHKFKKCPNSKVCGNVGLDDPDVFREKTTTNFSGIISKIEDGWVSKWMQIQAPLLPGVYAIDVKSEVRIVDSDQYEESDNEKETDEREVK